MAAVYRRRNPTTTPLYPLVQHHLESFLAEAFSLSGRRPTRRAGWSAVVGVYGVTAQALRRRTSEIGVRMALGAGAPDVVGLMLRQTLGVVAVGLVAGLGAAQLLARALRSLLYGVQPGDPGTLAAVAALLGGVALFASWLPARRASGVDPAISLRDEE